MQETTERKEAIRKLFDMDAYFRIKCSTKKRQNTRKSSLSNLKYSDRKSECERFVVGVVLANCSLMEHFHHATLLHRTRTMEANKDLGVRSPLKWGIDTAGPDIDVNNLKSDISGTRAKVPPRLPKTHDFDNFADLTTFADFLPFFFTGTLTVLGSNDLIGSWGSVLDPTNK